MDKGNKIAQDKLKLLYIIDFIHIPLTNSEITNYILEYNYMDYFTLQLLLGDLCDSNFLIKGVKTGKDYYSISSSGKSTLNMFKERLPDYFINEITTNFSSLKKQIKRQRELISHYYKRKDDVYIVSIQVMEDEGVIFNLSINVPTEDFAKDICKKWNSSPEEIFGNIIKILTTDLDISI